MKDVLLFVHGFGSSHRCWGPLIELLSGDERIMSLYELATWDYPTAWFSINFLGRIPRLQELGRALGQEIDSPQYRGRQVTLIGHSQGGLVIQSWMTDLLQKGEATRLRNVEQVLLLATPNSGSKTASGLRVLAASIFTNPQELTLRVLCPEVADMEAVMRDRVVKALKDSATSWRVPCHAFCGMEDNVVPEASARGCFDSLKPVPGNHFSILRPLNRRDPRYSELVELLLEPGGHVHRFDIELYETRLHVEPSDLKDLLQVANPRNPRTIYTDNQAKVMRLARFAGANRCRDPFTIRYATRSGGYIFPQTSHPNQASPAELGRWEDEGKEYSFVFAPDGQEDYWLDVEVYKGFDSGQRDVHFHLGNDSVYRELLYVVDLASYVEAGYRIISGPHLYFRTGDQGHTDLCRNRNPRDLVEPISASEASGKWCFRLQNIHSGVVDIVWDVAAVPMEKPLRDVDDAVSAQCSTLASTVPLAATGSRAKMSRPGLFVRHANARLHRNAERRSSRARKGNVGRRGSD